MGSMHQNLYHGLRYVLILTIRSRKSKCLIHLNFPYPFPFRLFVIEWYIFIFLTFDSFLICRSWRRCSVLHHLNQSISFGEHHHPHSDSLSIWKFCRYDSVSCSLLWGWNSNMSYMNGSFRSSAANSLLLVLVITSLRYQLH